MKFVATQKNTRQTPRKVRLVANQVKDLSLEQAIKQLAVIQRRSTLVILKTIKQAIANAQNNHGISFDQLELEEITVNEGPTYKRYRAVSRGRGHGVLKRSSHVRVILGTKDEQLKTSAKPSKPKKADEKAKESTKTEEKSSTKKAVAKNTNVTNQDSSKQMKQTSIKSKPVLQRTTKK